MPRKQKDGYLEKIMEMKKRRNEDVESEEILQKIDLEYVLVHNRSIISARKPNYAQKIIYVVSVIQRV